MSLKVVCAGGLVRYPLGGFTWHHLQYLIGLKRLGHQVTYFEHYGLPNSCWDPLRVAWTSVPSYGIDYARDLFQQHNLDDRWCFIAEDGTYYGMPRTQLAQACRDCDVFLNLSNFNQIPEIELCRRRVLVDTDPVFTQIRGHGLTESFSQYNVLATYGENVHKPGCEMPTADQTWVPTRQPIVLDLWNAANNSATGSFTTVMNWKAFGDRKYRGRVYGQKDRQFEPFFSLPAETGHLMELAMGVPPPQIHDRLQAGGWVLRDPAQVTPTPSSYQAFIRDSRAEFSVAKHAYVSTGCGWFSDRSAAYLASGRPVVIEDTGFSSWLEVGLGALAFRSRDEALESISEVDGHYSRHSRAAREIAEAYFDSSKVLNSLLDKAMYSEVAEQHDNYD